MCDLILEVRETKEIFKGQVVTGGVPISRIKDNLEDKKYPGIYYTGEVLDVDGKCGGYNLSWAFNSALIAAEDILKK